MPLVGIRLLSCFFPVSQYSVDYRTRSHIVGKARCRRSTVLSVQLSFRPLARDWLSERRCREGLCCGRRPPRGGDAPPEGRWQWTLNWDPITKSQNGVWTKGEKEILVGSCPKTAADLERLHKEAGVQAVLSMQVGWRRALSYR